MKSDKLLDDPKTTVERIDIISNKKLLKSVYKDFYKIIKSELKHSNKGQVVELGSGAGFIKKEIKNVITTDIMDLPNVDKPKVDAEKMPFKSNSLSAIVMLNVFHHINNPEKALKEFDRVLKKNGKIIMIEPSNTLFGRFLNQNFHHEEFKPNAGWKLTKKGPLSGGNGAIPWIVFERDSDIFKKKFNNLEIEKIEKHTILKYILSGGFSKPQLVPDNLIVLVEIFERLLAPFSNYLGIFQTIVLIKKS